MEQHPDLSYAGGAQCEGIPHDPHRPDAFVARVIVVPDSEPFPWAGESQQRVHTPRERFLLQIIQPMLVGLMDGSVSTLAPVFAVALATGRSFDAFIVGLASAVGAGVSMAIAEGLSDDGRLTGRGNPVLRGGLIGLTTAVGGTGHVLPFLIGDIHLALLVAYVVVGFELVAIALIRHRYFGVNLWVSLLQVLVGGGVVVVAGELIGQFGGAG